ncbi:MAG: RES family NAD+ phosphorylase [Pseudomonadota bacterium]
MWTPTALASEARPRQGIIWRAVESQSIASTRKLVATLAEQMLLEDILEESKPPVPAAAAHLHYLLKTPFRYDAPYPIGSRFRRANAPDGVFYGAEHIRTALAELCYFRLRFFQESPGTPFPREHERLTVFSAGYRAARMIDLTTPPFDAARDTWTHPTGYHATQTFADTARAANIDIIRYASVRDVQGINLALLSPATFTHTQPTATQDWLLYLSANEANCVRSGSVRSSDHWVFLFDREVVGVV